MLTCPDLLTSIIQVTRRLGNHSLGYPEAQEVRLVCLMNALLTVRALSFSFFFGTLWELSSCVFSLQILRLLNKLAKDS